LPPLLQPEKLPITRALANAREIICVFFIMRASYFDEIKLQFTVQSTFTCPEIRSDDGWGSHFGRIPAALHHRRSGIG
jgi:hypothetical protein